jgi:hypothetical protein
LAGVALVLLAWGVIGPAVTIAHEFDPEPGWLGDILTTFAGYVTPPLLGLGGAVLLKEGYAWPLLWIAVILLFLAWVKARDEFTCLVPLILAGFTGYVGLYRSPALQAAFATGLVLLFLLGVFLLGALRAAATSDIRKGMGFRSDAEVLADATLIPRVLWKAAYVTVALLCLWKGLQVLTR